MKKNIFLLTLLIELLICLPVSGVSVVYNFRIAQITRQPIAHQPSQYPTSTSLLAFDFFQKTRCFDIRQNFAGGLLTYTRNFAQKSIFRADFAVAHASQTVNGIQNVSVTESDDILFTVGRNLLAREKSKISVSGLFGIPTHSVNTLQRIGFGNGQVGIGAQVDGLYKFSKPVDFLWGARYNYFIPRTAFNALDKCYNFTIGSIADLLVALQTSKPLGHGIEGGYSARWGFGAHATPRITELDELSYMRNSFYLVYKYTFLTEYYAHRFLFNISYGFDSKPKNLGFNAVMIWASWGIAF